MKAQLLTLILTTLFFAVNAQMQVNWLQSIKSDYNDQLKGIEVDKKGNTYVIINFMDELNIDNVSYKDSSAKKNKNRLYDRAGDVLVLKYNKKGERLWSNAIQSKDNLMPESYVLNDKGELFIVVPYFGEVYYNANQLTKGKYEEGKMLVKFDTDGEMKWKKKMGTDKNNHTSSLDINSEGQLLMALSFNSKIMVDDQTLKAKMREDIGFICMDQKGRVQWTKTMDSKPQEPDNSLLKIRTLDISESGNIYVTGDFYGNHEIKGKILYDTTRQADNFLAVLNAKAEVQDVFQTYNTTTTDAKTLGEDVVLGGWFTDHMCLNEACKVEAGAVTGSGVYLAKMSTHGKVHWFLNSEGEGNMTVNVIETIEGAIYLAGSMRGEITFDGEQYQGGERSPFLMKVNQEGHVEWFNILKDNDIRIRQLDYLGGKKFVIGAHYMSNQKLGSHQISLSEQGNSGIVFFEAVFN